MAHDGDDHLCPQQLQLVFMQAALGDPLQYIGNLPFNFMPPMVGQPVTLDPATANPIPGLQKHFKIGCLYILGLHRNVLMYTYV